MEVSIQPLATLVAIGKLFGTAKFVVVSHWFFIRRSGSDCLLLAYSLPSKLWIILGKVW
jgi:hypothetical protein